jgi:hypothetical protein
MGEHQSRTRCCALLTVNLAAPSQTQFVLELNCWVRGDDWDHVFPIKIAQTESVGALKELIKEKKQHTFQHMDANTLKLWQVSVCVASESLCLTRPTIGGHTSRRTVK